MQRPQAALDLRDVGEELDRFFDRHLEHIGDRLALEADLQRLAVVAAPVALLAGDVDVRQKVHLDLDLAVAAADLAASALDVETEPPRLVAPHPRLLGAREEVTNVVEDPGVGRRVGAWSAPDRRLVDADDLVDLVEALDPVVGAGAKPRPVQAVGHRAVQDLVDEGRLAGSRDAGDAAEDSERHADVGVLEVVLARPAHHQLATWAAAKLGDRDAELAVQVAAGQGAGLAGDLGRRPLGDQLASVLAGSGAEVDDVVRGADRSLVVLDHDHRVAEIAQPSQRVDQLCVVALVEADRGLVEDVEDAHQRRADLGREPDPLGLAA